MMIRCLAIDDEPLALQQIVTYIHKVPFLELAAQCQSALEARQFLANDTVDAIFCDINMPDLNGMDFVKSLASPPLIVFTTAYSEYAVEGFKVNAVDYLLKPFGLQDFQRAANRLKERKEERLRVGELCSGMRGKRLPSRELSVAANRSPSWELSAAEVFSFLFPLSSLLCNTNGIARIVFTFAVTSSPCTPSPRVTACVSLPST